MEDKTPGMYRVVPTTFLVYSECWLNDVTKTLTGSEKTEVDKQLMVGNNVQGQKEASN